MKDKCINCENTYNANDDFCIRCEFKDAKMEFWNAFEKTKLFRVLIKILEWLEKRLKVLV